MHHIVTAKDDLANDLFRVGGVDLHFKGIYSLATGAQPVGTPPVVTDKGPAFSHSVTDAERQVYGLKEFFRIGIEGCPANDNLLEPAAKTHSQFLADLVVKHLVYARDLQEYLHVRLGDDGKDLFFVHLFNHQGNREYQPWPDLLEGCLLYTSPSPRDGLLSRMPSSA